MLSQPLPRDEAWPPLPFEAWGDTLPTLHRTLQIVGKVRLALAPMMNHWWQVTLAVTASGLTTGPIPYGHGSFQVDLDFLAHLLQVRTSDGQARTMALAPRPVAEFYRDFLAALHSLGIDVRLNPVPQEIPDDVTPFDEDTHHRSYDTEVVGRWFRALLQADRVLKEFRARFTGKCSPVHLFWGSLDLAVTRFSGRRAPPREGADAMTAEAYCEEVSSVGFWPGSAQLGDAAFYSYAAPPPPGFERVPVRPAGAAWDAALQEYLLPWAWVRESEDPRRAVLDFCQSTYEAAASLGRWNRAQLERPFLARPPAWQQAPEVEVAPLGAE